MVLPKAMQKAGAIAMGTAEMHRRWKEPCKQGWEHITLVSHVTHGSQSSGLNAEGCGKEASWVITAPHYCAWAVILHDVLYGTALWKAFLCTASYMGRWHFT